MPDLRATLTRLDGIATAAELNRLGIPGSSLRAAVGRTVIRVRDGVYALPDCDGAIIRAAKIGGRLAGTSAARHHGLWSPPNRSLVVAAPRGRHLDPHPDATVLRTDAGERRYGVASLPEVIHHVLKTEPVPFAVAILDSVIRRTPTSRIDLEFICRDLPMRRRRLLELVDARAESGTESVLGSRSRWRASRPCRRCRCRSPTSTDSTC